MARAHKVIDERPPVTVSSDEADELLRLTKDVRALWAAPATTNEDRKRLLRTVLSRVVVLAVTEAAFDIEVIWVGGHRGADVGAAALTKMTQHQLMFEGAVTRAFNAQGPDQSRILGAARAVYTTVQTALASTDATHPVAPILSTNRSALKDTVSASMILDTHLGDLITSVHADFDVLEQRVASANAAELDALVERAEELARLRAYL